VVRWFPNLLESNKGVYHIIGCEFGDESLLSSCRYPDRKGFSVEEHSVVGMILMARRSCWIPIGWIQLLTQGRGCARQLVV
jgi:hypothetical protein